MSDITIHALQELACWYCGETIQRPVLLTLYEEVDTVPGRVFYLPPDYTDYAGWAHKTGRGWVCPKDHK